MSGTTTISGTIGSGVTLTTPFTRITHTGTVTGPDAAVTGSSSGVLTLHNAGFIDGGHSGVRLGGAADHVINCETIEGYGQNSLDGGVVLTDGGLVDNGHPNAVIVGTEYGVQI